MKCIRKSEIVEHHRAELTRDSTHLVEILAGDGCASCESRQQIRRRVHGKILQLQQNRRRPLANLVVKLARELPTLLLLILDHAARARATFDLEPGDDLVERSDHRAQLTRAALLKARPASADSIRRITG